MLTDEQKAAIRARLGNSLGLLRRDAIPLVEEVEQLQAENAALRERLEMYSQDNEWHAEQLREAKRDNAGLVDRINELEQREQQARAIIEFVEFVAGCYTATKSRRILLWQYDDADTYVTQARTWLADRAEQRAASQPIAPAFRDTAPFTDEDAAEMEAFIEHHKAQPKRQPRPAVDAPTTEQEASES